MIVAASALGVGRGTIAAAQSPVPDTGHLQSTPHGRVLGVYDQASGDPIAGAEVTDLLTGDHTLTTATGTVSLWFLRAKGTMLEVRKIGYEPWKSVVDPNDSIPMTVLLQRLAELPTVHSTAKLNIATDEGVRSGFDRRCAAANVSCLRENVLESHPSNTLGDLLVRSQGIVPARGGLRMHSNGTGLCKPTYYVDGIKWGFPDPPIDQPGEPPGGQGPHPPPFNVSNVEEVEVYPPYAQRPLRFAGDASCGVIAIWTK